MQVKLGIDEPGLDESNHLFVAIKSPEFVKWVFEKDSVGVDTVGLVNGKALIVLFEDFNNVSIGHLWVIICNWFQRYHRGD